MTDALPAQAPDVLLDVNDLVVHFPAGRRRLLGAPSKVHAVDGVSFRVQRGTTFGIVGESGSGKSTTAQAIMRLIPATSGQIVFGGDDIAEFRGERLRQTRRKFQIVFQDPFSSLDPRRRAGDLVREPLDLLGIGSPSERDARVSQLLAEVGLPPQAADLFPHQFSGGQRQRLCIARAMAPEPDLIVCDEAVSALDVAIQAQILNLLKKTAARARADLHLHFPRPRRGPAFLRRHRSDVSRQNRRTGTGLRCSFRRRAIPTVGR